MEFRVHKEQDGSLGITIGGGIDSGVPEKTQIFVTDIKFDGAAAKQVWRRWWRVRGLGS